MTSILTVKISSLKKHISSTIGIQWIWIRIKESFSGVSLVVSMASVMMSLTA